MYIGCSHGHNDSSHAVMLFFFSTDSKVLIRLRGRAGSYGFAVLMSIVTGLKLRFFFFFFFFFFVLQTAKSRSGCTDAQAYMDIRCSQGRSISSHAAVLFFFQLTAMFRSDCAGVNFRLCCADVQAQLGIHCSHVA